VDSLPDLIQKWTDPGAIARAENGVFGLFYQSDSPILLILSGSAEEQDLKRALILAALGMP
jgi:hypothetical protein